MVGLLVGFLGAFVTAMAVASDGSNLHAPRWVAAAGGAVFLLAGAAVLKQYAIDGGAVVADDPWGPLFGALISGCLTAVSAWIAFAPGDRSFQVRSSVPIPGLPPSATEWIGRIGFGIGAILAGAITLAFAMMLVRRLLRAAGRG